MASVELQCLPWLLCLLFLIDLFLSSNLEGGSFNIHLSFLGMHVAVPGGTVFLFLTDGFLWLMMGWGLSKAAVTPTVEESSFPH